jgi:hypothetical protein
MSYGLEFYFVEVSPKDPMWRKGTVLIRRSGSPVVWGRIFKVWLDRQWTLKLVFSNPDRGNPIGGYYDTKEEAMAAAKRMLKAIMYDPREASN